MPARRTSSGLALLDALIAMAALAFGLLGHAALQAALQHQAQTTRHRVEALNLARAGLEASRRVASVAAMPGRPSWDGLQSDGPAPLAFAGSPAGFEAQRIVQPPDAVGVAGLKVVLQEVSWHDRHGALQHIRLRAAVAAVPPALTGALALRASGWPVPRSGTHDGRLPADTRALGDGRGVFQPVPGVAWIVDLASGDVVGVCDAVPAGMPLDAANLDACARTVRAQRISGFVRFASSAQDDPLDPQGPALNLDLALSLDSDGHPGPGAECLDDAPRTAAQAATQHLVRYHCLVHANAAGGWTGRLDLRPLGLADQGDAPWPLAAGGDGGWRVCRYSTAAEGQWAPNAQHPARYTDVHDHLTQQNFLVLPSALPCPTAGLAVAHQP